MMLYYKITKQNSDWALCVNENDPGEGSKLIVSRHVDRPRYGLSDYGLWEVSFHENNSTNVGFTLINKKTGLLAVPESNVKDARVVQKAVPADRVPSEWVWQTNRANHNSNRTIMPLLKSDLVMMCSHAPNVQLWDYCGGEDFEIWNFGVIEVPIPRRR